MRRNFILIIFLLSLGSALKASVNQSDIIYGEDDRLEVEQTNYGHIGRFMAAMVNTKKLNKIESLQKKYKLCDGEKYAKQPALSSCSGLLIKGKYIVTAAHCLGYVGNPKAACNEQSWLFDYKTKNGIANIDKSKLYKCKKVIEINKKLDYALIELNSNVAGRYFSPKHSTRLTDEPLITLGFPAGLPLKVARGGLIKKDQVSGMHLFNFDTFHGSSGSPIFNETGEILGLLKFGKSDFFFNEDRGCYTVNKCSSQGESCSVSDSDELQGEVALLFSQVSRWSRLRRILK